MLHILYTIIHFVDLTLSYKGQRQLKVLYFSVEWYNLEHIPLIQLHSLTNRSPPLISQPVPKCRLTASPRGKPRAVAGSFHHSTHRSIPSTSGGCYPPLQGVCNTLHRRLKFRHGATPCLKIIQSPPHVRKLGMGRLFACGSFFLPVVSFGHKTKEEST